MEPETPPSIPLPAPILRARSDGQCYQHITKRDGTPTITLRRTDEHGTIIPRIRLKKKHRRKLIARVHAAAVKHAQDQQTQPPSDSPEN